MTFLYEFFDCTYTYNVRVQCHLHVHTCLYMCMWYVCTTCADCLAIRITYVCLVWILLESWWFKRASQWTECYAWAGEGQSTPSTEGKPRAARRSWGTQNFGTNLTKSTRVGSSFSSPSLPFLSLAFFLPSPFPFHLENLVWSNTCTTVSTHNVHMYMYM